MTNIRVYTSIDRLPNFGKRAYNHDGMKRFKWESRDEYGVYRDEQGYTRAIDGRIIHASKADIKAFLERASLEERPCICLPEHAKLSSPNKLEP